MREDLKLQNMVKAQLTFICLIFSCVKPAGSVNDSIEFRFQNRYGIAGFAADRQDRELSFAVSRITGYGA